MIRIKYITHAMNRSNRPVLAPISWDDCLFIQDAECRDYDWAVVYDDMPRRDVGTIRNETEVLCCPPERTILVTAEPPSIKIYPKIFTRQFGYVLTTHAARFLPHGHHRYGHGCLHWMADYALEEVLAMPEYPKSRILSTVCSSKQQKHTQHYRRYLLTKYLAEQLPELDWYGRGVRELNRKYDALNAYKYHIAVENYLNDYHWTDKISDPILGLCLTFYAGDPKLGNYLPPESFIPIPLDDPPEALRIIREAIDNNEYEKRLPAIREARRLIVTKYNMYAQVVDLIHEHMAKPEAAQDAVVPGATLRGRHTLRRCPLKALSEFVQLADYKWHALLDPVKH